jgi:hypothetical protein
MIQKNTADQKRHPLLITSTLVFLFNNPTAKESLNLGITSINYHFLRQKLLSIYYSGEIKSF